MYTTGFHHTHYSLIYPWFYNCNSLLLRSQTSVLGLYKARCSRFLWLFLHHTWTFGFLKIRAAAMLEERFSGNIGGDSSRHAGRCPPVYHTHTEEEKSKTKIKPRKLSSDFWVWEVRVWDLRGAEVKRVKRRNESKEDKSALETTQQKRHLWLRSKEKKISCTVTNSNYDKNRFLFFYLIFFFQKTQVAREWLTHVAYFIYLFFLKKWSGMTVTH